MEKVKLQFDDPKLLYRAYMPFVKGGGLFIATPKPLEMGVMVDVSLTLPGSKIFTPFQSAVIWVAAKDVLNEDHQPGYGFQIQGDQAEEINSLIQLLVKSFHEDELPTDFL